MSVEQYPKQSLRWTQVAQGGLAGLAVVLLVAGTILAYRGGALAALAGADPPDVIVVVVADALRADRLSCYGYTSSPTPNISSLAHDGVLYRHMSSQTAWTKPSVATILSSLYPSSHQACAGTDVLPDEVLTLAEILAAHDYYTVGFVSNYNLFTKFNFQQGFAIYHDVEAGESHQPDPDGQKVYAEAQVMNWYALGWLKDARVRSGAERFFLYLHYMDPHRPYHPHPYDGRSYYSQDPAQVTEIGDAYDSEIAYFDRHLGNLLDTLKRLGLYDDALIVFTSDHGEEFYEHQGWAHGKTLYQEIIHVPLIIKYPGNMPGNARAGTVDEGLASSLDIAPTILDVAGIAAPAEMQGVSLRLRPDSPARAPFVFAEDLGRAGVMALRTPRYKLIQVTDGDPRGRGTTQFYDLEMDPRETTNLATTQSDLVARLRADMSRTLVLAERAAVSGQQTELTPEFIEILQRLGY